MLYLINDNHRLSSDFLFLVRFTLHILFKKYISIYLKVIYVYDENKKRVKSLRDVATTTTTTTK